MIIQLGKRKYLIFPFTYAEPISLIILNYQRINMESPLPIKLSILIIVFHISEFFFFPALNKIGQLIILVQANRDEMGQQSWIWGYFAQMV
jgi:hypothetical protein